MKVAVLGAGMVGRAIALDLARDFAVTSFDRSGVNLDLLKERNDGVKTQLADFTSYSDYNDWLDSFDIVVTAVPGFMGFKTLETVIQCGKNVVDISFFPEDAMLLDSLARKKNVTAITDCGVAPGVSNFIIGRYNEIMEITAVECYVGGLPKERKPPFQYKAPFSPVDVIEEYTRPARLVESGEIVVKPALSDRELISFDEIGDLEAFNTDGLRSLLFTMKHIRDMKEKTLRYPGHIDLIIALQQAGFFDKQPIRVNEEMITPFDLTSQVLIREWKLGPGEEEFTIMKVIVKGKQGKKDLTVEYDLLDRFDPVSQTSSMARTTGYTCSAAVNLVAKKLFDKKGVFPPELVGSDAACFDFLMNYLGERNVNWVRTMK